MADVKCGHTGDLKSGKCESCAAETCHIGVTGCRCAVGWPHELQCPACRDNEKRMDNGYCVCTPSSIPPRSALPQPVS